MSFFIVIHNPEYLGNLKEFMLKNIINDEGCPHSVTGMAETSMGETSKAAAKNGIIYVVGYRIEKLERIYELGYKFVSTESIQARKGYEHYFLWKFKNAAGEIPQGHYFNEPMAIDSKEIKDKLMKEGNQMREISQELALEFDQIFKDNHAISF
jgi:hypothetical protein